MSYDMGPFDGAVCLKDWFQDPFTGRTIRTIMGKVKILEGQAMIGFDPGKNEANWIARVDGSGRSYNFPGCQVRCVITGTGEVAASVADALDVRS